MIIPPLTEAQERPLTIDAKELVILQPKFDGCQAIFIPTGTGYKAFTRKGQEITRLQTKCAELDALKVTQVYFSEYEPKPWTEEGKNKLAGNLYNQEPLPFETALRVFDAMDPSEFQAGNMRKLPCKPRLVALDTQAGTLAQAGLEVSPWTELPYEEAKRICKASRIATHEGTRCVILGHQVEGGIIRAGAKIEKDKAKQDKDIAVLTAVSSSKGQRGWIAVDTKIPDPSGLLIVFGGITPKNHQTMVGHVVEVEMLTVSGAEGGGNPTFKRDRSNEKDFGVAAFKAQHAQAIERFAQKYAVSEIGQGI